MRGGNGLDLAGPVGLGTLKIAGRTVSTVAAAAFFWTDDVYSPHLDRGFRAGRIVGNRVRQSLVFHGHYHVPGGGWIIKTLLIQTADSIFRLLVG